MKITRTSAFTGKVNTIDLPVNEYQIFRYEAGALVQDAFPQLDANQREFIISGVTPDEWTTLFPPNPEDN